MSTTRKKPAGGRPAAPRRKPAARKSAKKQRRFRVQNPVNFRAPVIRNKRRRSKRTTTAVIGSILTAILTVAVAIVFSVVAAVITGLITGVATGIAAARSEPGTPKPVQGRPAGRAPGTPKPLPPGAVPCGAPLSRGKGTCSRPATPGQNCGIPSHPAPPAAQQRTA